MASCRFAFSALLKKINPSPGRSTVAQRLPGEVRDWLKEHDYETNFPHSRLIGSYGRHTATGEIKDVDALLFLPGEILDRTPKGVLRELKGSWTIARTRRRRRRRSDGRFGSSSPTMISAWTSSGRWRTRGWRIPRRLALSDGVVSLEEAQAVDLLGQRLKPFIDSTILGVDEIGDLPSNRNSPTAFLQLTAPPQ